MSETGIVDRVRSVLEEHGTACSLDDVTQLCPDLTWNQVFLAVDFLSRTGQADVILDPRRVYWVQTRRTAA
ncbi:MAG TPA: hypothetical protein VN647_02110 [Nitrospira sp.]|nr:hypothetical protein [Nitrospira sp.]